MKKLVLAISWFVIAIGGFDIASAHPGRTDASGCHTCRTNCPKWGLSTGEYHCHNAKILPQPEEPVKSHYSETGGYTESAPEYKAPVVKQEPIKILETAAVETKEEQIAIPDAQENVKVEEASEVKKEEIVGTTIFPIVRTSTVEKVSVKEVIQELEEPTAADGIIVFTTLSGMGYGVYRLVKGVKK